VNVVHVQLVPVVAGAADDPVLAGRLGEGESKAIRLLGFAADRDRAVTARAAARLELGRRLGVQPRLVRLSASEAGTGQPVVRGTDLAISWSHSGDWVALAVATGRLVGVDIERLPATTPAKALQRIGVSCMREFVAREAVGKLTGLGLGSSWPAQVSVRPFTAPAGYLAAVAAPGDDWSLDLQSSSPPSAWTGAMGLWDLTGPGAPRMAYGAA